MKAKENGPFSRVKSFEPRTFHTVCIGYDLAAKSIERIRDGRIERSGERVAFKSKNYCISITFSVALACH